MRLNIRKKGDYIHYCIIRDYTTSSGKRTTSVYENLGNQEKIELEHTFLLAI